MVPRTRVFSADDQLAFARLSGDYNPIHLDPVAARRLLFGQPVVHGMHALLWAFDTWLDELNADVRLTRLKVRFRGSIPLDTPVEVAVRPKSPSEVQIEVLSDDAKALTASVSFESRRPDTIPIPNELPPEAACRGRGAADLPSAAGQFPLLLAREAAGKLFANVASRLPAEQVAMLLAATRVVGMEAPGLHSILAGLHLHEAETAPTLSEAQLRYRTDNFDERVSRLELDLESPGLAGKVTAFLRPLPQAQPSLASLRSLVSPDEFRGERALVIGGSRGLGEVTVKLLAAGGAEVRFSYHRGQADADRLAAELTAGGADAGCFAYDVLGDAADLSIRLAGWSPTLLCYFATPFISAGAERRFAESRFENFCRYYVGGFASAFDAARRPGSSLKRVLYPSTVYVDELPLNLGEYAAAKAAAETLCRFLAKAHPEVQFGCPRLPRLATDQTASLIRTELPEPAPVLLAALRELIAG